MLRVVPVLGACLVAVGCLEPPPAGTRSPIELDTTPGVEPHEGFSPVAFQIASASFAIDPVAGQATGLVDRPLTLVVGLYDQSYVDSGDPTADNHCLVTLETDDPLPVAPWTLAEGAWFAFELPADAGATVTHDCDALDFPPEWGDDPLTHVTSWGWGAGVNPLDPGLADALEVAWGDAWQTQQTWIIGAGYTWERLSDLMEGDGPDFHDRYVERGWGRAWRIAEGALVLEQGERVPIEAAEVASAGGVEAWYETTQVGLLQPASRLVVELTAPTD